MKTMKNRVLYTIVLVCTSTGMISQLNARVRDITIKNEEHFMDLISEGLSVAMFYDKKEDRDLEKMFGNVSDNPEFKEKNVLFLRVNVAKSPELENLASKYGIESFPAFILLEDGKPEVDAQGKVVILYGAASEAELENFIDGYLGQEIEQAGKEGKKKNPNNPHPRWRRRYLYDPYYDCDPVYDPYCDYPYRRRYYGYPYPGFGIHFGIGGRGFHHGHHRGFRGRGFHRGHRGFHGGHRGRHR